MFVNRPTHKQLFNYTDPKKMRQIFKIKIKITKIFGDVKAPPFTVYIYIYIYIILFDHYNFLWV
jgi:hypothetical protein